MKPKDYIAQYGIDYFSINKGKAITVRLLSDDSLIFSGHFIGIFHIGNHLPLIDGLLIEEPQFNLHMMYKNPDDGRLLALNINLLLVDDMEDIKFE
ncbi:MAG: hypothetical protein J5932_03025 [Prevotella sp.]|nr:hypothetical protein [Prevotella sp.]MBP3843985.1 hypothetical protein [Prevotella sp.]